MVRHIANTKLGGVSVVSGLVILALVLAGVVGYLIGSISFAIIVSKLMYREDVRNQGSGNAGMTNVLRNYGKISAILTLIGDMGKGILAVWCGRWLFMLLLPGVDTLYGAYIAGITVLIGHALPLFFKFKGGKGVAVTGGAYLGLCPLVTVILLATFAVIVGITRIFSFAAIIVFSLYPIGTLLYTLFVSHENPLFSTICAVIMSGIVIWMHRDNIRRLREGTEYKFGSKKDADSGEEKQDQKPE